MQFTTVQISLKAHDEIKKISAETGLKNYVVIENALNHYFKCDKPKI